MISVCLNGILFSFKNEEEFNFWSNQLGPEDLYFIVDELEYQIDEAILDTEPSNSIDEKTVKYSERPVCPFCEAAPVIKTETDFCPLCSCRSIFAL